MTPNQGFKGTVLFKANISKRCVLETRYTTILDKGLQYKSYIRYIGGVIFNELE